MASRLFDPVTRERAWLLYAWCRACDDLADGQEMGHGMQIVADPAERLAMIRRRTAQALAGVPSGDPAFDGFGLVARESSIPPALAEHLIEGFALDARSWRPTTENDLYQYCYHVAGAVGIMMALVMGVKPADHATLDRACDLGLAFQLANIARDVGEDHAAGRRYLPLDWLEQHHIPEGEMFAPAHRAGLAELGRKLAERSGEYEGSARVGAAALPFRSAWAVLAAAGIYGDIAREVALRGEHAWEERIVTSKSAKLGWVAKALIQAFARKSSAPRSTRLWQRPRIV